jgi:hypothetical protein
MQDRHITRSARPLEGRNRGSFAQNLQEQFKHRESRPVQRRSRAGSFRLQVHKYQSPRCSERVGDANGGEPASLRGEDGFARVTLSIDASVMFLEAFNRPPPLGISLLAGLA